MATKVGSWDCPYCGHKGNLGYEYECAGCEHPRPKGIRFYLPENAPVATPEQKAKMGNDPNWYCAYCECGNKDTENRCWKCGAPRGSDSVQHRTRVYVGNDIPRSVEEAELMEKMVSPEAEKSYIPDEDPYNPAISESEENTPDQSITLSEFSEDVSDDEVKAERKKRWVIVGSALVALLVLLGIYFFFIRTTEQTAVVDGFSWSQNVVIEEYQTHHKEGWTIPIGGRETGSDIRQSGTERISDGYHMETRMDTCYRPITVHQTCTRDNGNGSFDPYDCSYLSEEPYSCPKDFPVEDYHYEPVFSVWYFYDIDEWTMIGNYPTSGNDRSPYFDDAQPSGDLQRRIEQTGTYTVYFSSEDLEPFSRTYDVETWRMFDYGQKHKIIVNAFKIVLEVK